MRVDFHTHSTASDGKLSPRQLVERAKFSRIDMLSITDHDTVNAYKQLPQSIIKEIKLVPGVEFSTQWKKTEIHIVGLNIDPDNTQLNEGIHRQQVARVERAEKITKKLNRLGLTVDLSMLIATTEINSIGRPHLARYLVESKLVSDEKEAFDKYLKPGKPAYCQPQWSSYPEVIGWIHKAGGKAVLAHPLKYKLTRTRLEVLINDFVGAGGEAIETVSGQQDPARTLEMTRLCKKWNLLASCGSDFHEPGQPWAELGKIPVLPEPDLQIWRTW